MDRRLQVGALMLGVVAVAGGLIGGRLHPAAAGTEQHLLVSFNDTLFEYTQSGTLLRVLAVPYGNGERPSTEHVRDIAPGSTGDIVAFNGTFDPFLSTYDIGEDAWSHATAADWAIKNNGKYGGVATFQQYAFVTDMTAPNPGIVRFDMSDGSVARTSTGTGFIDLNVGWDGRLYGLDANGRDVFVYDPLTLAHVETVTLAASVAGIAVDANGEILGSSTFGGVQRFDADGVLIESLWAGEFDVDDIDVAEDGRLVGGTDDGDVVVIDAGLGGYSSFNVGWDNTFVAFTDPLDSPLPTLTLTPTPTPIATPAPLKGVVGLTSGGEHSCAVLSTGGVQCWGDNSYGQLGDRRGCPHRCDDPVNVAELTAVDVSAGLEHTCAITLDGAAVCWGRNRYGEVGDGTTEQRDAPVPVAGLESGVAAIDAGNTHTCALLDDGGVKCWGDNNAGRLGDGTAVDSSVPVDVVGLDGDDVVAMSAGGLHTCVATAGGLVKCWGSNISGQIQGEPSFGSSVPVLIDGISEVADVVAGWAYTCVLTTDRTVTCWGQSMPGVEPYSPHEVPGLPDDIERIDANFHTCAVTGPGGLQCWGDNAKAQLGDGTTSTRSTAVTVAGVEEPFAFVAPGRQHTCAATASGKVVCWGSDSEGQVGDGTTISPRYVLGLESGMTDVEAGYQHTCAMSEEGTLRCWGRNDHGQVGDGTTTDRAAPVDVVVLDEDVVDVALGSLHTCVVSEEEAVRCWGDNEHGQLGDGTFLDSLVAVEVEGLGDGVAAITSGGHHTCALTDEGRLLCWGDNGHGQLGDGTNVDSAVPVEPLGHGTNVIYVAAGRDTTCAIKAGGTVNCWGDGPLGDGTPNGSSEPVAVLDLGADATLVDLGEFHTCVALVDGAAMCWGMNLDGQVGDGTDNNWRYDPTDVAGFGPAVADLSLGGASSCVLGADGGLYCWGNSTDGLLGGNAVDLCAPNDTPCSRTPVLVPGLSDLRALSVGSGFICVVLPDGSVQCWGDNEWGQVGNGVIDEVRLIPAYVGEDAKPAPPDSPTNTPLPATQTAVPTSTPTAPSASSTPQPTATQQPTDPSEPTNTVALSATPSPEPEASPPASIPELLGDPNCDGVVDVIDAALTLQLYAGLVESLACESAADVNGDGSVDSVDAVLILQSVAGLLDLQLLQNA